MDHPPDIQDSLEFISNREVDMSDETKTPWTEGPWQVKEVDPIVVLSSGRTQVAHVTARPKDIANARLIAAAPRLVKLLEKANRALDYRMRYAEDTEYEDLDEAGKRMWDFNRKVDDLQDDITTLLAEINGHA